MTAMSEGNGNFVLGLILSGAVAGWLLFPDVHKNDQKKVYLVQWDGAASIKIKTSHPVVFQQHG